MPDKSAEKFARVVEARLVPPLTYIIRFPNGEKIGPWKSSVAADEVAEVINAAHEKALSEARNGAARDEREKFRRFMLTYKFMKPYGRKIYGGVIKLFRDYEESIRALRGNG